MTTHTNKYIMSKGAEAPTTRVTIITVIITNCALFSYKIGGGMLYAKMD
jgi:hypothetical protein